MCYCAIQSPTKENEHYNGALHAFRQSNKNKIISFLFDKSIGPLYYCPFCLIVNRDQKQLQHHLSGKKHLKFFDQYEIYFKGNSDPDKVIIKDKYFCISKS